MKKTRGNEVLTFYLLGEEKGRQILALCQIVSTLGALDALEAEGSTGIEFLHRHFSSDFGKISEGELEEHYRKRSLLLRSVFPEDIAEGVYFFASDISNKSTGNFLNVDAGNAAAFTR